MHSSYVFDIVNIGEARELLCFYERIAFSLRYSKYYERETISYLKEEKSIHEGG